MAGGKKASKNSLWPPPQPIEESDQDIRANAISLLKTTKQWLTAADSGGLPSPDRLSSFLVAVISLTTMVRDDDVLAELQRIRKLLAEIDQKHMDSITRLSHTINITNTRQVPVGGTHAPFPGRPGPASYRDALAAHVTSQASLVSGWLAGAKTNGATPSNNLTESSCPVATPSLIREDLQLVIRLTEVTIVNPLRHNAADLIRRANRSIQETNTANKSVVSSGRVLPSGDLLLQVDNLEDMRLLHQNEDWCKVFGEHACIRTTTFAVVMNGVRCESFDPQANRARAILRASNNGRLPANAEIVRIGWMMTKRKMDETRPQYAKLVVEFNTAEAANCAIRQGLSLHGEPHDCRYFDGSHRLQQCFRCQSYGHVARNCKREAACAYCADSHDTKECAYARDRTRAKCAVCITHKKTSKLNHFAFDRECPVRNERIAAVESHRSQGPHLHKEPLWSTTPVATPPPAPTGESYPTLAAAAAATAESKAAMTAAIAARSKAKAVSVANKHVSRRKKRAVEDSSDGEMDVEADIERAATSAAANANTAIVVRDSSVPLPTQQEAANIVSASQRTTQASQRTTRASQRAKDLQQSLYAPKQTESIDLLSDIPIPSEEPDEDYLPTGRTQRHPEAEEDTETESNLPAVPRPRTTNAHTKNQ